MGRSYIAIFTVDSIGLKSCIDTLKYRGLQRNWLGQWVRLNRKVAIVTGSGAGIGQAVALRFAQEGARVVRYLGRMMNLAKSVLRNAPPQEMSPDPAASIDIGWIADVEGSIRDLFILPYRRIALLSLWTRVGLRLSSARKQQAVPCARCSE